MAFDFACTDRRFAPPPLPDLHDRVEAVLSKASAPVQHGRSADAQGGCDAGVGHAVLRHQESFGPDDYAMRRRRAARPLFKEVPILFGGRTVSGDSPASHTQISVAYSDKLGVAASPRGKRQRRAEDRGQSDAPSWPRPWMSAGATPCCRGRSPASVIRCPKWVRIDSHAIPDRRARAHSSSLRNARLTDSGPSLRRTALNGRVNSQLQA